ncbi:cupin domain-containing protein [Rhizobium sp. NFR07]|uniref:cupin domain-containing protein n=1 Tax=Rhizobium sp. NFR07 TaxID=1566262 RepID=UPI000B841EE4|nr:cupin domain-containing protein [Rhizobium sp. NFR07]
MKRLIFCAIIVSGAASGVAVSGDKETVVTKIAQVSSTMSGQPLTLPPGEIDLIASDFLIPPDQTLPVHRHPYPRYAYVLSGRLAVTNLVTNETKFFGKGEIAVESLNQ